MVLLTKCELNSIGILISKASIDSVVSHYEFALIKMCKNYMTK